MRSTTPLTLAAALLPACNTTTSEPAPSSPELAAAIEAETESVKPGINERWINPELDVDEAKGLLESESREIWILRQELVDALELEEGDAIADVGAGTGMLTWLMAEAVGADGRVYAVELSERLIENIDAEAIERGLGQVETLQCEERDSRLPPGSVDVVFTCDTYHHFEYPLATLASLYAALRPGGELVIVDFEKIEGVSRDFVFGHVRLDKPETIAEVESAGFEFVGESEVGLSENYFARFRRP